MQTLQKRMWKFLTICCISMWSSFFNFLLLLVCIAVGIFEYKVQPLVFAFINVSFLFGLEVMIKVVHTQKWIWSKKKKNNKRHVNHLQILSKYHVNRICFCLMIFISLQNFSWLIEKHMYWNVFWSIPKLFL